MHHRWFLGRVALLLTLGCGSSAGSYLAMDAAASSVRSGRLDSGFFFGHDLRTFDSIVYVLDLSGSMSERTGSTVERIGKDKAAEAGGTLIGGIAGGGVGSIARDTVLSMDKKVELVKDHLNASLRGLPSGAEFNIVMFSDGVQKLSPVMITANTVTTAAVSAFISRLGEGGSTSMKRAIEAGLQTDAAAIMVLTDGLPTDATPQDILATVAAHKADERRQVYTVGVGADQAKDFLSRLARDNGGEYIAYE